jgi:CelD/BcsL family acetyltransferase involved in cellulose biosynthesis
MIGFRFKDASQGASAQRSASMETLDSSLWTLTDCSLEMDGEQAHEIASLADRTGGRNIFFEPAFLQAAGGRIGASARRLLILTEQLGEAEILRLALPFSEEKAGFPPVPVLRAFSHPYAPLSLPLIDEEEPGETVERFAALLRGLAPTDVFLFEDFPVGDEIALHLVESLRRNGFRVDTIRSQWRARLRAGDGSDPAAMMSASRRKRIARLERRLREAGKVEFESAERLWDVLLRFEEFLVLETRGWKGRRGSSIHVVRKTAAFARQAVSTLAAEGRAVIYSLRIDGNAIASLIMLRSANRYYPWKIAFDEAFSQYSPGTQLMLRATRQLLATPGFEFADSLASETAWIDALWPGKHQLATLVVTADEGRAARTVAALNRYEAARRLAKSIIAARPLRPAPPAGHGRGTPGE